jgi:hypothetical protein
VDARSYGGGRLRRLVGDRVSIGVSGNGWDTKGMASRRRTKGGKKDEKGDHTRIKYVLLFHAVRHFRVHAGKSNRYGQVHVGLCR